MAVGTRRYVTDEAGETVKDNEGKYVTEVVKTYEGAVLSTYERNGYDDSDFYAVVWDEDEGKVKSVQYATTRAWTYDNYATVDATDEVKAKAAVARGESLTRLAVMEAEWAAAEVTKGKLVRVKAGRRVAKPGTEGTVFWKGVDNYKTSRWATVYRVGVETAEGDRFFIAEDGVEVVDSEQYVPTEDEVRVTVDPNTTSWRNAVKVGRQYVEV